MTYEQRRSGRKAGERCRKYVVVMPVNDIRLPRQILRPIRYNDASIAQNIGATPDQGREDCNLVAATAETQCEIDRHDPELTAYAEGYAEFAMKNSGQVPTTMLAVTPQGLLHFLPESLADETAKNNFAEIGRLICAAYGATCMVMILESWVTMAKPDEALDMDTPPSEAFDREEFVVVMGETFGRKTQRFLPILRTDAGGFFGFGEFDASKFNGIEGRFAGMLPPKKATRETREMTKAVLAAMGVTLKSLRAP